MLTGSRGGSQFSISMLNFSTLFYNRAARPGRLLKCLFDDGENLPFGSRERYQRFEFRHSLTRTVY